MSCNLLAVHTLTYYVCYNHIGEIIVTNEGFLYLLVSIAMSAALVMEVGITILDGPNHCFCKEEDSALIIRAVDAFVQNDHKSPSCPVSVSFLYARDVLVEIHDFYLDQGRRISQHSRLLLNRE